MVIVLPVLMMLLGWLMVSRVRYVHIGNWFFSGRRKLVPVMLVGVVLVLAAAFHELIGIMAFGTYVVGFMIWDLIRSLANARARRRLRKAGGPGTPGAPGTPGSAGKG
jgi:phosphatidylserine synthase